MPPFVQADNGAVSAPGLAIVGGGSTNVKYGNTFRFRAAGRLSASITTATAPNLLNAPTIAPYPAGVTAKAGNLKDKFYRIYALVATLPNNGANNPTATYAWLASGDFDNVGDVPNLGNAPLPDQPYQAVLGWVVIQNASGADFIPGTTALDASNITVTYIDNTQPLY